MNETESTMLWSFIDHLARVRCSVARTLFRLHEVFAHLVSIAFRLHSRYTARPSLFPPTPEQQAARKQEFIASISHDAVCSLASRLNDGKACHIFGTSNGSFNACYFVRFPDDDKRWVIRIPIEPAVHDVWAKLQSEVATMRYVQSRTKIPVPDIQAFGRDEALTQNPSTKQAYLITDYISGHSLDVQALVKDSRERREYLYSQLIDILADMRQLELPSSGSLMPGPDSEPVVGPINSIPINELQIHGQQDLRPHAAFSSTTEYVRHQLQIMAEFYRLPVSEQTFKTAQVEVFALDCLNKELPKLIDARFDAGPFVLCHQDLKWHNIIVDDSLKVVGVIDWEWTASVPLQLFTPPFWIAGQDPSFIARPEYLSEFVEFRNVLLSKQGMSEGHDRLAEEWDLALLDNLTLPMAELLRHHSQLIAIFNRAFYPKLFQKPKDDVILHFYEENRALAQEVQRRWEYSTRYTQYLKENRLFVRNEELARALELARRMDELERSLATMED